MAFEPVQVPKAECDRLESRGDFLLKHRRVICCKYILKYCCLPHLSPLLELMDFSFSQILVLTRPVGRILLFESRRFSCALRALV